MKIYIAHNFDARTYLNAVVVPQLTMLGHTINARWLTVPPGEQSRCEKALSIGAKEDWEDVYGSNLVIHFADQFGPTPGRGKYVELGLAYAAKIPLVVIGAEPEKCVFYFLDGVKRYYNFPSFYRELLQLHRKGTALAQTV